MPGEVRDEAITTAIECDVTAGQAPAAEREGRGPARYDAAPVRPAAACGDPHGAAEICRATPRQAWSRHQALAREHGAQAALRRGSHRHRPQLGLTRALGKPALALAAAAGAYWLALRPWHLRWGATDAEVARRWPGDELVVDPSTRAVRAVTVNAPAADVWPWIMQVGRERGSFYSYTWVENLIGADIRNVDQLLPGLPARRAGDTVWMGPRDRFRGMARMIVAKVEPSRAMVLVPPTEGVLPEGTAEGVWSFSWSPHLIRRQDS
jgi:hypothetical protein